MTELCMPFLGGRLSVSPFAPIALALMYYIEGAGSFFIILSAALIHEAGHTAAIYALGSRVMSVEVHPVGAVIKYDSTIVSYKSEAIIAMAGPLVNLLFAFISAVIFCTFPCVELLLFVFSCIFFALFNLLPLRGNDGFNALRAFAAHSRGEEAADRIAKRAAMIASAVGAAAALWMYAASGSSPAVAVLLMLSVLPN